MRYFLKNLESPKKQQEDVHCEANGLECRSPYRLTVYLACWLFSCIFPIPPKDNINPKVILYVVKLAQGKALPLAPMFLDLVYYRLDSIHKDSQHSVGRYDIANQALLVSHKSKKEPVTSLAHVPITPNFDELIRKLGEKFKIDLTSLLLKGEDNDPTMMIEGLTRAHDSVEGGRDFSMLMDHLLVPTTRELTEKSEKIT
ncbi:hypothetical protein F0562_007365 [Nyssa sinensis]|uniref:Uncharacterized protein n=1 Tax=Nyssa sinensis TaxID=561372 RepID=A0A5J5A4W7_9ASTE|nr:hypothetical protein F0562_007365 [Nyssa sinensis]